MTYEHVIWGRMTGEKAEELDVADTRADAREMIRDYRETLGPGWSVWSKRRRARLEGDEECVMCPAYKIVRRFEHHERQHDGFPIISKRVIKTRRTLAEAREHCRDPETSSFTCTRNRYGNKYKCWFDGYERM